MNSLNNDWQKVIGDQFNQLYFKKLESILEKEYEQYTVYPAATDLFNAFHCTPYSKTKVVILGQDPYHGPNQAHGLSFSVKPGAKIPPSLRNIFKEMHEDVGVPLPSTGSLIPWAKQGVLLLNTVLSVRKGQAASHKGIGWETFTDAVIKKLNERCEPVIFVLWGKHAQAKKELITHDRHHIIESAHPSPFSASRGFFGSRPFSKVNQRLEEDGFQPIQWNLDS